MEAAARTEKIPSLLIAASARCFLSSLALPGPLRSGTAFGMFPPCAALLSHQPPVTPWSHRTAGITLPEPLSCFSSADVFLVLL